MGAAMSFVDRISGSSLAGRLMLWFVGAAIALVLLTAVLLYFALAKGMEWRDDQVLLTRALTVRDLLSAAVVDPDYLDHEVSEDLEGPRQLFIRIVGPASIGTHETADMPKEFPKVAGNLLAGGREFGELVDAERRFRTLVMLVPLAGQPDGALATIQLAMDTSLDGEILGYYMELAAMVVAVALILSVIAGWYIVRTQLRPLRVLATAAARVERSTLDYRVAPDGLPSELREYVTQFNHMLDRLEAAYEALRRYADDVAHELRTPINRIQLGAEVALREARTPETYRDALESTLEECMHLGSMVKSLLFLARVENGQATLLPVNVSVAERLEKIRAFFQELAADGDIDLRVECEDQLWIMADATLFQRAVSNVVSNSLAHTPRGGRISMRAVSEPGGVVIEIADSGEGIAPEHQNRIFDRFYRVDRARVTANDRVGLGLAITKSIVELHQGRVAVRSSPGAGATFLLHFPVSRNAGEKPAPEPVASAS